MNTIKLNTLGDKVIVRKAAENGGNAGGDNGGTGGGSASGGTWRYFDTTNKNDYATSILSFFFLYRRSNGSISIYGSLPVENGVVTYSDVSGVAVDESAKIRMNGMLLTWNEVMELEGLTPELLAKLGIFEITESEFYNLES